MARDFNGTTQYLENTGTAPVSTYPATIAVRMNPDTIVSVDPLFTLTNAAGTAYFQLHLDTGFLVAIAASGATTPTAVSGNSVGTGAWSTAVGVFNSSTDRTCYLDGDTASAGTSSTAVSPTSLEDIYVANFGGVGFDGKMADVALWDTALTADEVVAYDRGMSPLLIKPGNLVAYWPLIGRFSPEIDVMGGLNLTLVGTPPVSAHAPVFFPKRKRNYFAEAAAGGGTTFTQDISAIAVGTASLQRQGLLNIGAFSVGNASCIRQGSLSRTATAVGVPTIQRQGNLTRAATAAHTVTVQRQGNLIIVARAVGTASLAAAQLVKIIAISVTAKGSAFLTRLGQLARSATAAHSITAQRQGSIVETCTSPHTASVQRQGNLTRSATAAHAVTVVLQLVKLILVQATAVMTATIQRQASLARAATAAVTATVTLAATISTTVVRSVFTGRIAPVFDRKRRPWKGRGRR
jgi:hypothetical protein